jgi:hypothetical protein
MAAETGPEGIGNQELKTQVDIAGSICIIIAVIRLDAGDGRE